MCSHKAYVCSHMSHVSTAVCVYVAIPPSHGSVVSSVAAGQSQQTKACFGAGCCQIAVCFLGLPQYLALQLCHHCSRAGQVKAAVAPLQQHFSSDRHCIEGVLSDMLNTCDTVTLAHAAISRR